MENNINQIEEILNEILNKEEAYKRKIRELEWEISKLNKNIDFLMEGNIQMLDYIEQLSSTEKYSMD